MGFYSLQSGLYAILLNAEFQLIASYRIARYYYLRRSPFSRLLIAYIRYWQLTRLGCEISPAAQLGQGIRFPHPNGVIIGEGVVVGDYVRIFQQVTLGSHGRVETEKSYPNIGNEVVIYAGAKVLGNICIEKAAVIGSGAVVLIDVPTKCIAVGIPAKVMASNISG